MSILPRSAWVLLQGVVGSTAYGLATPDSDVDVLGVFAHATQHLLDLEPPPTTYVGHEPDITFHEAHKFAKLALKCNPTVTEIMWLPEDLYQSRHMLGDQLIGIREAFLSKTYVRNAYLGYATQQFKRLSERGRFDVVPQARIEKHARHLARLAEQGYELYSTGHLEVRLADAEWFHDFGRKTAEDHHYAKGWLAGMEGKFNAARSPLPEQPNVEVVQQWLRRVRAFMWLPEQEL